MDDFLIGTGERLRFALMVQRARFTMGADGGRKHLLALLETFGFEDIVLHVDRETLPADWPDRETVDPLQFPEWPAWFEGTWSAKGTAMHAQWPEMRVLRRYAAPPRTHGAPAPVPAVSDTPISPAEAASNVVEQAQTVFTRTGFSRTEMRVGMGLVALGVAFGIAWEYVAKPGD